MTLDSVVMPLREPAVVAVVAVVVVAVVVVVGVVLRGPSAVGRRPSSVEEE